MWLALITTIYHQWPAYAPLRVVVPVSCPDRIWCRWWDSNMRRYSVDIFTTLHDLLRHYGAITPGTQALYQLSYTGIDPVRGIGCGDGCKPI